MKPGNPSKIALEYMEQGKSASCPPIIDMHGHFGPLRSAYLPSHRGDKLRDRLKRCGVKRLVCSAHEGLFGDPPQGANEALQEAILRYPPDTFLGYWIVNPPNVADSVGNAADAFENSQGFVGFKLGPDYHLYPITGPPLYEPVLEYADQKRLLVLVHTWGNSPYNSPGQLGEVAAKFPNAVFLMGHSGFGEWETALQVAKECPNVYLELTAVYVGHDFTINPSSAGFIPASWLQVNGIIEHMVKRVSAEKNLVWNGYALV